MAIVYSYPLNNNIKILDELVGTTEQLINGQLKIVTRNFLLLDLIDFLIIDGGVQKQIELTTVGTSGAATLNQTTGVLNIPIYETALQDLQSVANIGYTTTTPIIANSFVKIGGTGNNLLLDNGTTIAISSVSGNTNLSYIQATDKGTVTSDTGTDAIIPLTDTTNAGLFSAIEKIKLGTIATGAEVNVNADWNATTGDALILNKPTIPIVTGFVPYTGATTDVNLGVYDITASHLIKDGGQVTQFLKADGSVDNNVYLTSADLPSTLDLYATTTASDVSGYSVLVRNISDSRFNTVAVDVSTGPITTTAQLVGSLISDANIISGNPGIFNITTIGNISRTNGTGQAEFFFRVYKRTSLGIETFITESSKTLPVTNGGYVEFSAVALWNDGIFLDTDRVVLKYYADRLTNPAGSNPTYNFQFGGISPVRSTAAIPTAVLPNIYLRDLADVENVDPLNNEILYWNDADSLWEHSSVIGLIGYTPVPYSRTLTINGVPYDLSADRSWTVAASGKSINIVSINTTAGSVSSTDYVYLGSGNILITLPTAVGNTNLYTIKNIGTGIVTIGTTSSQTIDGSLTAPINIQYLSLTLVSNGTDWNII